MLYNTFLCWYTHVSNVATEMDPTAVPSLVMAADELAIFPSIPFSLSLS